MSFPADVVLSWFAWVPDAVKEQFSRPTAFLSLPTPKSYAQAVRELAQVGSGYPVLGVLRKFMPSLRNDVWAGGKKIAIPGDVRPLRVGVFGFSEGCQGVQQVLQSLDGGRIDFVYGCDGPGARWLEKKIKRVNPWGLEGWRQFAQRAVKDGRAMVLTGSQVQVRDPRTGADTHSNFGDLGLAVWASLGLGQSDDPTLPIGVWKRDEVPVYVNKAGCAERGTKFCWPETVIVQAPSLFAFRRDGLVLLGYENRDPSGIADHRYQAQRVLPLILSTFLANRWNLIEPSTATTCYLPPGKELPSGSVSGWSGGDLGAVTPPPAGAKCVGPNSFAGDYGASPTPMQASFAAGVGAVEQVVSCDNPEDDFFTNFIFRPWGPCIYKPLGPTDYPRYGWFGNVEEPKSWWPGVKSATLFGLSVAAGFYGTRYALRRWTR